MEEHRTFEEGVVEGRLRSVEETLKQRGLTCGAAMIDLRNDMTGMGESIRLGFIEANTALKEDIIEEISKQVRPVVKELNGNGQPGLIKRFERSATIAKINWAITLMILGTIIGIAFSVWGV